MRDLQLRDAGLRLASASGPVAATPVLHEQSPLCRGRGARLPGWWMDDAGFLYIRPPARPPAIEPIGVSVTLADRHL